MKIDHIVSDGIVAY